MASDLIERLRTLSAMINMGEKISWGEDTALMDEAATALAIERERADRAEKEIAEHRSSMIMAHGIFSTEIARERERAEKAETVAANASGWRCFHCDEVFTEERCARDHFGADETREPACRIKAGAERSMLTALRRAEADAADAWFKIHNEATDSAKAFHGQAARHQEQLRATEELGYERGLRDAIPGAVIALAEVMKYLEGSDPMLMSGGIRNFDLRQKVKTILFTDATGGAA